MKAIAASFSIGITPRAGGGVYAVIRRSDNAMETMIGGATEEIARRLAHAYIDDELAKLDRKAWGIKRRRSGRRRQAAFKAAAKAQRP